MNIKSHQTPPAAFETITSNLYQQIRDAIIRGNLGPGERLVRRSWAQQYGVSRVPITEALIKLEQDGLVESAPMFGTQVKRITEQAIRDEQQLREALECHSARLCAERHDASGLVRLSGLASEVDACLGRKLHAHEKGGILHLEFHLEIARRTGVALLVKELERIGFIELMRLNWINATTHTMPTDWHQTLVKAIATGNPDIAERAMRAHVRFGGDRVLKIAVPKKKSPKA